MAQSFEKPFLPPETPSTHIETEIQQDLDKATVVFQNLELTAENPKTPAIAITAEKLPTRLVEGQSYCLGALYIDAETEKVRDIASKAESLQSVPEHKRPRAVLELFRESVSYAYNDVLAKLAETDPNLAEWVATHTGLNASAANVPLSQLMEKGYGVCRHLAVAYLWLAQKAGLQGTLMTSYREPIKNIQRSDTGKKLFQSVDIGGFLPPHAWAEIKTTDGKWIPVDPSTKLVGDTEEGLRMFQEANYTGEGSTGLEVESLTPTLGVSEGGVLFKPGEPTATGRYSLFLRSIKPTIRLFKENLPPTNLPYSGDAIMQIEAKSRHGVMSLELREVEEVT